MSAIVVCLDCPNYQKGGWCRLKKKEVGALQEACERAGLETTAREDLRLSVTEKQCPKCGRVLPKERFAKNSHAADDLQSHCRECNLEAYNRWREKHPKRKRNQSNDKSSIEKTMETTITTKTCPRCGRELPCETFGKHARTRDGLQPYCKECRSQARIGKSSRPGQETQTSYTRTVVRETLTDKQMVDQLREHGWTVTCTRTITEEL